MKSLFLLLLACLWAQASLARGDLNTAISDVKRILVPHHPPGHDADILDHLSPKSGHSLFFRESAKKGILGAAFGQMNATFTHPTVLLDHSSHVLDVHCSKSSLKVCFRNEESRRLAALAWQSHLGPFFLSPFHKGCGKHHEGQRSYFKFGSIAPASNARCADVQATDVPAEDAMESFDLDFGHEQNPGRSADLRRRSDASSLIASQETIDISDDEELLSEFFGVEWNTTYPANTTAATPMLHNGTVEATKRSSMRRSNLHRRLWGPFQAIVDVAEKTKNVIVDASNAVADAAVSAYNTVVDFGKDVGRLVQDSLNYEWSLGASISRSWDIGGAGTQAVPTSPGLFGEGEGLAISSNGLIPGNIQCENCYARGDVSVAGHIGWTLNDGLKTGYLEVGGEWDSRLALGFQISGQAKVEAFQKKLLRKNLVNLEIPGVIAIGPEVTLGVVFDIYFQAQTEMLLGAQFKVSRGSARIDLVDKQKNHFNGFVPSLEPIAKYRGKEETGFILDFGLPLGLEFGVRLLGGKWEKSVGLFDQPSFQVKGKAPAEGCNGIDMSLAIQNYIYLSASGLYDYAIDTRELWNKPLGCIASSAGSSKRLSSKRQAPRSIAGLLPRQADDEAAAMELEDPEDAVDQTFEDGAASTKPPPQDKVPVNASQVDSVTGYSYRLLADLNETAILVSGKEDRLYLAPYGDPDASSGSPFSTEPSVSDAVILGDVFGGYLNFSPEEMALTGVSNLRSSRLTKVYEGNRFISLTEVQVNSHNATAGMYVAVEARTERVYSLVTCSVIDMGTRMYVVDPAQKDIVQRLSNNELEDTIVGGPVRGCQYVYLTSRTRGLQLPQVGRKGR